MADEQEIEAKKRILNTFGQYLELRRMPLPSSGERNYAIVLPPRHVNENAMWIRRYAVAIFGVEFNDDLIPIHYWYLESFTKKNI